MKIDQVGDKVTKEKNQRRKATLLSESLMFQLIITQLLKDLKLLNLLIKEDVLNNKEAKENNIHNSPTEATIN